MLAPGDPRPWLAAAEVCRAAGRNDAAITNYQKALAIIEAIKPPPEAQRLATYGVLIALLDEQKRGVEADRYRALRNERVADSAPLTLMTVAQALRDGKPDEALAVAQSCVKSRPADPVAFIALARAQQAKKADAAAADAYRHAFEAAKEPALKLQLAERLLRGGDPHEAAEAEKAARELLPQYAPAGLLLVGLLERPRQNRRGPDACPKRRPSASQGVRHALDLGQGLVEQERQRQGGSRVPRGRQVGPRQHRPHVRAAGVVCRHRPAKTGPREDRKNARRR